MPAYYNEHDPFAAAWLRELIRNGHIAPGDVDERSIADVRADDLRGYTQCHFFAGIGGWSLALRYAGIPDDRPLWTGSCPCQPFSLAGQQKGFADERHLWPVWFKLICERRPARIFGEQVASATEWLRLVRGDLGQVGYAVGCIPFEAASAGADHLRNRYGFCAVELGDARRARFSIRPFAEIERGDIRNERQATSASSAGSICMADAQRGLAQRRREPGEFPGAPGPVETEGRERQRSGSAASDHREGSGDVGIADSARWPQRQPPATPARYGHSAIATGGSDMADPESGRGWRGFGEIQSPSGESLREMAEQGHGDAAADSCAGGVEWVIGADGKTRRVKSGVRLLVDGFPNRVGLLRGFGNAIDPRAFAQFIAAAEEAVGDFRMTALATRQALIQADGIASESACAHTVTEQTALDCVRNPRTTCPGHDNDECCLNDLDATARAAGVDGTVIANQANLQDGGLNPDIDNTNAGAHLREGCAAVGADIGPADIQPQKTEEDRPASPDPLPPVDAWIYAGDDAEQLTRDPVVKHLLELHSKRRQFPAAHPFSMTNPIEDGTILMVASCKCGHVIKFGAVDQLRVDAAIEAHWQRHGNGAMVDGRGQPISSSDGDGESRPVPNGAVPVAARGMRERRSRSSTKAAGLQREAEAGWPPENGEGEGAGANRVSPDSDRIAGPSAARGRAGVAPGPSETKSPSEAGGVAIASEPAPVSVSSAGAGDIQPPSEDDPYWNDPFVRQLQALAWRDGEQTAPTYEGFLRSKVRNIDPCGFEVEPDRLNAALKPFQRDIVGWLLKQGKGALFAGTGLGKTLQQLAWADQVVARLSGPVLVLTPLAVAQQTVAEAQKFGIASVAYAASQQAAASSIVVTNYERLQHFDPSRFAGVVLDESSILKAFDGKTRNALTDAFSKTPFRLCCTATPAPNDYTELGNHSEFLGILQHKEMLATWFVHDGSSRATNVENYGQRQGSDWRLKGHAHDDFWRWLATWSVMVRHPRDLGYEDAGYDLPPLHRHQVTIATDAREGLLGDIKVARTLSERLTARRETIGPRVAAAADIVTAAPDRQWLVWCNLNDESSALTAAIPGAVEVRGSDDPDVKAERLLGFARGEVRVLVSKPSIAGWGMNFQSCADMVFVGLNDSFEQLYQAVRRCWRFGQTREVNVHLIAADVEGEVVANLQAKEEQADYMAEAMVGHMRGLTVSNLRSRRTVSDHNLPMVLPSGQNAIGGVHVAEQMIDDQWALWNGDCVAVARGLPDASVHYTIYSPPFPGLFTFSDDLRDMSNSLSFAEFWDHYTFLIAECFRITKPGRLVSIHCMQLPTSKTRDGFIGLRDFRGDIISAHQRAGFIYHSEVCIRKDPVQAMQRTKHIGLLHKQLAKDSALSRMAVADYIVTMRKPGENAEPIAGAIDRYFGTETTPCGPIVQESRINGRQILWPSDGDRYSIAVWQRYAEPVWMDIAPSDVLSRADAREEKDERHISPLQLTAIRRCVDLWSNEKDVVFSPFAGIGSELVTAVQLGRRAIGSELKPSYYRQAISNLRKLEIEEPASAEPALFDIAALDAANVPPPSTVT